MHNAIPAIVGTWHTTVPQAEGNPRPTFEALLTFLADGNMVEVNSMNPAMTAQARGVWTGAGDSYRLMFEAFSFNEQGQHTGKIRAYLAITMKDADHFTATYTADLIDLAGKVAKNVVYGASDSTRMKVEWP